MRFRPVPLLLSALIAAGCAAPPPAAPPPGGPQPGDLVSGIVGDPLEEREPDLCRAAEHQRFVGQPGSIVPALGITRRYRVIEFGGIVTQEYDAGRLNFYLSPDGIIQRVACG
jgi:hypothetical protein